MKLFVFSLDPRMQPRPPAMIQSREGDCPWRLFKVMYVKDRIPRNIDMADAKYKNDPRVQKILKMQEIESGKVIDHTKAVVPQLKETSTNPNDVKLPDLLDPNVFKAKEASLRPALTPFVDPLASKPGQGNKEPQSPRPLDPRIKSGDPRIQKTTSGVSQRPVDPRFSRQDSNSSNSSLSGLPPYDPRVVRQNSQIPVSRDTTPPLDPRTLSRQSSFDPRLSKTDSSSSLSSLDLLKIPDPRLSKVVDSELGQMSMQRQASTSGTDEETSGSESQQSSKPKLDYRNDPRFKRKRITESNTNSTGNLSPESSVKRYGQRKSSTEYSSPLGAESGMKSEDSGYNSYNRPRPTKPPVISTSQSDVVTSAAPNLSTQDILDSLQIMPPPSIEENSSDKNLKDIFKTIDPTASPFC